MTRGHRGSLLLRCRAPSSPSPCRFIPAHSTSSAHTERSTCDRRIAAAEPILRPQRPCTRLRSDGATSSAHCSTNTKPRREDRVCAPHEPGSPGASWRPAPAVVVHYRSDAEGAAAVVDAIGAAGSRAIAASAELLDRAAEPTRFSALRHREPDARRLLPGYKTAGCASVQECHLNP